MIGFGEMRRLALVWQTDIARVERVFALDWLLKGIFDREVLRQALALRGAAALSKLYFADYPPIEDVDFARGVGLDDLKLESELVEAAEYAARISGMSYKLNSLQVTEARFEYTGPLGRRSAAQPHVPLRFHATPLHAGAVQGPMLHPFADRFETTVRAVSLEETAAERIALIGQTPRAREVYDLWFILRRGGGLLDRSATRALAETIAAEKGRLVSAEFDPAYRPLLERAWENALKHVRAKPSFVQAEAEIKEGLAQIWA
jgi:hypothetical protein